MVRLRVRVRVRLRVGAKVTIRSGWDQGRVRDRIKPKDVEAIKGGNN